MSSPAESDLVAVKRIGRYLLRFPHCHLFYPWQSESQQIRVFTDSDWANCTKTRRSTSGGCIMRGRHLVGHWSRTQQVVALSSGEAELNSMCKGSQEGLSAKHLSEELGMPIDLSLCVDASAACGIALRQGAGKVKHLSVSSGCKNA